LSPEWTEDHSNQSSIHWLESHLDSEPTTVDIVSEGAPLTQTLFSSSSEGANIEPFTGNINKLPVALEPIARHSQCAPKPTERLIEDPIFGLLAMTCPRLEQFNLRKTAFRTMSFIALQARHNACMNQLHDGTLGNADVCAFPSVLADNDTYFYGQAMNQPDRPNFIKAMVKEIDDLFQNDVWQLCHCTEVGDIQTIKAVWSFKRKRSPYGTVTKHKARLCAQGDMQVEGVHFWDTYSPVVQLTTVRILLILSLLLGLKSRSIDFTLAFTQASIDVLTYLDLPTGFSVDGNPKDYVLELKKTLYGLRQAGLNWFDTLCNHLLTMGFTQSVIDPCCYIKGNLILL